MAIQKLTIASPETGERKHDTQIPASKKGAVGVKKSPAGKKSTKAENKAIPITTPKKAKGSPTKTVSVKAKKETQPGKQPSAAPIKKFRKLILQLHFHTAFGQELFVVGDHPLLGNDLTEQALPMQYVNDDHWVIHIDWKESALTNRDICYHYLLRNSDGTMQYDWGTDKKINPAAVNSEELLIVDAWNYAGYFENTFYTEPFTEVLLKDNKNTYRVKQPKKITHTLKVKSPLLSKEQTICVLGSDALLGTWDTQNPVLLGREPREDIFTISLDLSKAHFPLAYKYGIYDTSTKTFVRYEDGNNRLMQDAGKANRKVVMNDGFAILPNNTWKGAGIAIPVFSLRSEKSFGIGEFTDMALLADWAKKAGLKMIQLLPINDTTATHTWVDSYPYAAISAFALHPMYLNLSLIADAPGKKQLQKLEKERQRLNGLAKLDYEAVNA
ncbi:MAG: 4-alpha-glucanotransferase, partial [Bacteroidota bacterium]|nr:4-alpha-glucanotransferase [Bacteroidota bacterium]